MIAGLLLAAGGARRFGSQKLVALLGGEPLVRRAAQVLAATTDRVTVVVGNEAAVVQSALNGLAVHFVENSNWSSGLASSLVCGIQSLPADAEAVVIALGDQPHIDPTVVRAVVARWRAGGCAVVATRYDGVQGHPVLFSRELFGDLLALTGDSGAKRIIEQQLERTAYVDVPAPAPVDVDTVGDLEGLGE
ncbi:MAG: nucleotidyltransferase family protein [Gemmatimonadaceae bacterium]